MRPKPMSAVVKRKRYNTENAALVAGDDFWDGHNWERQNRNRFMYRTPKGNYFLVLQSTNQGEKHQLTPLTMDEAIELWDELTEQRASFEEAFPGVEIEEA